MQSQHEQLRGQRDLTQADTDLLDLIDEEGAALMLLVERVRNHIKLQRVACSGGHSVTADSNDTSAERVHHPENLEERGRLDAAEPERWASIGRTHFQEGLMALRRAVEQPGGF